MNTFANKIRTRQKTILYELLPPPQHCSQEDIEASLSLFAKLLRLYPVDAVNIPEVQEETRNNSAVEKKKIIKS